MASAVSVIACADPPLPTTPAPGAPCGVAYKACYSDGKMTGCCGGDDACGGSFPNVGCPAGYCCFAGESPDDLAQRRMYKQLATSAP